MVQRMREAAKDISRYRGLDNGERYREHAERDKERLILDRTFGQDVGRYRDGGRYGGRCRDPGSYRRRWTLQGRRGLIENA